MNADQLKFLSKGQTNGKIEGRILRYDGTMSPKVQWFLPVERKDVRYLFLDSGTLLQAAHPQVGSQSDLLSWWTVHRRRSAWRAEKLLQGAGYEDDVGLCRVRRNGRRNQHSSALSRRPPSRGWRRD